jgi:signal transduction histidine kinase
MSLPAGGMATNAQPTRGNGADTQLALDRLDEILAEFGGVLSIQRDVCELAASHGRAVYEVLGADRIADAMATLRVAAAVFRKQLVELAARPPVLRELVDRIEDGAGVPPVVLGQRILDAPELLELPTKLAIEVQLGLLLALTRARAVSVWTLWPGGDLRHVAHSGDFDWDARQTRQVARRLLSERAEYQRYRDAAGILVERWGQPGAALVARGRPASSPACGLLLEAAAPMLRAMLERDELLGRGNRSDQAIVAATERRLARLRFDLHDGPQQDVLMLAEDLRSFRSQLMSVAADHPHLGRLAGRIDDLEARLIAIDGDLRRLSASVQSPFMDARAFPDALAPLTDSFTARTGIEPDVTLTGIFTHLTDSQHITLVGLIREALNNIREHSDADHVTITVCAGPDRVEATVTDDGRGFDPEVTLVQAARGGHLGLVGMHERVRLLGGQTRIDSRPGGPTVISASLPAGPPAAPAAGNPA